MADEPITEDQIYGMLTAQGYLLELLFMAFQREVGPDALDRLVTRIKSSMHDLQGVDGGNPDRVYATGQYAIDTLEQFLDRIQLHRGSYTAG